MDALDWIDKHYRLLVVAVGLVALALYVAGWSKTSFAVLIANVALLVINAVRASRDPS